MAKYDRVVVATFSRLWVFAMVMLAVSILFALASTAAHAASLLPSGFGSLLGDAKTNIIVMGGLIIGVVVSAQSFIWVRRVLRSPQSIDPDFVDDFEHVEDKLLDFPDLTAYELAGENEDVEHSQIDYETRMAMASWEEGYEAQVLRQEAGEYSPYEFVGSEFQADVESAKEQEPVEIESLDDLATRLEQENYESNHDEYGMWTGEGYRSPAEYPK